MVCNMVDYVKVEIPDPVLDPCPFCRENAHYFFDDTACYHGSTGTWYAACDKCGARIYGGDTKQDAADKWNRRDELQETINRYQPDSEFLGTIMRNIQAYRHDKDRHTIENLKYMDKPSAKYDGCRTCDVCGNRSPICDFGGSTTCYKCRSGAYEDMEGNDDGNP
jgi:Lar family restriction alleviation protein